MNQEIETGLTLQNFSKGFAITWKTDPHELSREASETAVTHAELRKAYEISHDIAVYANDMMVAGRINGFNVSHFHLITLDII